MQDSKVIEWLQQGHIVIPKLLLGSYNRLGLNEEELVLLLHIQNFIDSGNQFPTPDEISARTSFSTQQCTQLLKLLLQKNFITITEAKDDQFIYESYSLQPLYEKLYQLLLTETFEEKVEVKQEEETQLYITFEQEFGRPLSPFETEMLSMWIDDDKQKAPIIKLALREAVLSGKLSFKYIDRILFEWKRNGIDTVEQAQEYTRKFRLNQKRQKSTSDYETQSRKNKDIPIFNWLES
ncbi:DnaD domain protein [Bacillus sp. HMF5848]|uniref:DnaD domain-containing protein n=1 Tax=Bacillus sp. HMF5848 TaxID=2495421 RepID=UPI000F7B2929|nr:DnaD domain-containing protein [Bacillus sp. HMF5848]RSK27396.1 DnaD domain protein [Bacillus sp. HMF5848]